MYLKFFTSIIFYTTLKSFNLYPSKSHRIIVEHLFGQSFKFKENSTKDRFIVFKYYIKVLGYKIRPLNKLNDNEILIFDNSSNSKQLRIDFLSYYLGIKDFDFTCYEDLCYFRSRFGKFYFILFSFPFIIIILVFSQFFYNKPSIALFVEYPLIISNLIKIIEKNKCLKKIYYFSIYERESNFFAREIMKAKDLEVNKISSDTPLIFWNKYILSDKLLLCNYYQYEEMNSNQFCTEISDFQILGPERSFSYRELYNRDSVTPPKTIGFYSTASWVRDKSNNISQGINFTKMELKVLHTLKTVVFDNNNIKLFILIHPKENFFSIKDLTIHYSNILGFDNFEILNYNKDSAKLFDKVDLGISFNSTIIHERLYCGFKSLLFPSNPDFPLINSSLSNICANSSTELKELILESLKMTTLNFFKSFDLNSYSFRKIKF